MCSLIFPGAFDKVWHEDLVYKPKKGISAKPFNAKKVFLVSRKQRVILNGEYSSWASSAAGVPGDSFSRHLLFLIYINDLSKNLSPNSKLFADETSLFSVVHNLSTFTNNRNKDLNKFND